ncbi:MAG TPA: nucleotidyltransferase family protein [Thermoanaerobaculia bacterium]|nr:nucleotidyltransferase family protein [Thermoanaerobaculia bacterium]
MGVQSVAIVPAAGVSRRMGRAKLLLPWGEGTVIGGVVAALRHGGVGEIVVVVAPRGRELASWGRACGLTVAVNPRPEEGMLSTIRVGMLALGGAERLVATGRPLLIAPGDLPGLAPVTVRAVLAALDSGAALAVPVHRGRRGHPLGIAPPLLPEIEELDPTVGLRQLLERHTGEVVEVAVEDPGAVADVDTPEDYARLAPPGRRR